MTTELLRFYQRTNPSANSILLLGPQPMLVDTGFGSDVNDLEAWLTSQDTPAAALNLIVNTHHHCDHVGGNHALQTRYGMPIAAHAWDAELVNQRHPEACGARWLNQPIQAYRVQRPLRQGDTLDTGNALWYVIHMPGHTQGHLSLHHPETGTLIAGDAALDGDVGWLNLYRDGLAALSQSLDTTEKLLTLNLRVIYPGHGPVITEPGRVLEAARVRLQKWQSDPEKVAWHGCKRIMAYALMYHDGLSKTDLHAYLNASPWVHDFAQHAFNLDPQAFQSLLIQELERSGAARWQDGKLTANGPHVAPPAGWATSPTRPQDWGD